MKGARLAEDVKSCDTACLARLRDFFDRFEGAVGMCMMRADYGCAELPALRYLALIAASPVTPAPTQ